jgi:hypothetical protein
MFIDGAQYGPLIDAGEWWRLFSAMFLHANIAHIGFNMWALFLFGPALERRFGSISFAALYVASGLGGGALYHLVGRIEPAIACAIWLFKLIAATFRQRTHWQASAVLRRDAARLNLAIPDRAQRRLGGARRSLWPARHRCRLTASSRARCRPPAVAVAIVVAAVPGAARPRPRRPMPPEPVDLPSACMPSCDRSPQTGEHTHSRRSEPTAARTDDPPAPRRWSRASNRIVPHSRSPPPTGPSRR